MRYGIQIVSRGNDAGRETFGAIAETAEATGLDTIWVSDHLIIPPNRVSRYPLTADGQVTETWKQKYYQPFSVLNFLAACTKTVRLGTSVLILPMRNPIEMAAQVAELDQLSRGRADFGVGIGWFREEFEALGYRFEDRAARTDEGIAVMKALWADGPTTFEGKFHRFADAILEPKPVQRPHPPIYIGGNSQAAIRRTARLGDVWHPIRMGPDAVAAARTELEAALAAEGRAADAVRIAPKVALTFQDGPPAEGQDPTQGRPQDIIDEICFDTKTESRATTIDALERFANQVRPKV